VSGALSREDALVAAFRRNLVVAASAGTGKTHRLTGLYALLALGLTSMGRASDDEARAPISPSRIVATTFSRAAAGEIAERVRMSLEGVAAEGDAMGPHDATIRARLERLVDPPSRDVLRERARRATSELGSARIDTVHGVAARIVTEHAVELGIPPGARILDEGESRELDTLVVDETLHDALAAGDRLADGARTLLAVCGGLEPTRLDVATLLARLDEEGATAEDLERTDHVSVTARLRDRVRDVAAWMAESGALKNRDVAREAQRALETFDPAAADPSRLERALASWFAIRLTKKTAAEEAFAEIRDELGKGANASRGAGLARMIAEAPRASERDAVVAEILALATRRLRRERDARRALSFGDVLRIARDGMRDRPGLARRVRASIDVLLVDEFQDTSPVQRDLVLFLREREIAGESRRPQREADAGQIEPAGLFLVGDRKQSIYGFRGADVAVFARLCAELAGKAAAEALELPAGIAREPAIADFVALRETYRAGPRITAFVNAVAEQDFGRGPTSAEYEVRYGGAEHLVSAAVRAGDEVILIRDDGRALEGTDAFVASARGALRASLIAARAIESELLVVHAPRDIAVLTRRRSTIPLVEVALARHGIPYVVAGRALFDAPEVRDLAALLRLLLDPREKRALATVLRGPIASLSDEALVALSIPQRGLDASRVFGRAQSELDLDDDDRARLVHFRDRFMAARPALLRLAPATAIHEAVRAFDLDLALAAMPRAAARIGNLERLEDLARGRGGGLAAFSRFLETQIASETDGEEAVVFGDDDDAVRVTTIHASKGLDFPAVVLLDLEARPVLRTPGLGFGRVGRSARLLVRHRGDAGARLASPALAEVDDELRARELAERKRLSYVAITRAKDRLVAIVPPPPARPGSLHATIEDLGATLAPLVQRTIDAASLLESAAPTQVADAPVAPPAAAPKLPTASPIARVRLATTPLGTFRQCPRRFRLRHLLGFDEPVAQSQLDLFELPDDARPEPDDPWASAHEEAGATAPLDGDPRVLGRAAHRVLETWPRARWGDIAPTTELEARLHAEGVDPAMAQRLAGPLAGFLGGAFARRAVGARVMSREHAFTVGVPSGTPSSPCTLELRGAMDLLVVDGDTAFVVDYKLSHPARDLSPWAFQLRTYALAARDIEGVDRVVAGVVFLHGAAPEPRWLDGGDEDGALGRTAHEGHARELSTLGQRFSEARWADRWEGVPKARCTELRCGFITACHGKPTEES
jgi:ATP-dependent helicase/nuclease subunit A